MVQIAEQYPNDARTAKMDDGEIDIQDKHIQKGRDSVRMGIEDRPVPPRPLNRSQYGGPVTVTTFEFGAISIRLARPADPDRLLDDPLVIDWNRSDDYMPYWPYVWPSALLLAEWMASVPLPLRKQSEVAADMLEIGCGLGLPGLVAVARAAGPVQ